MKSAYVAIAAAVIIIGALGGYYYFNGMNLTSTQNTGSVAISVADAPVQSSVTAVNITFSSVALHSNTTGWQNYSVSKTTVDILGLTTTNASLLSTIKLHTGTYNMIRLYITNVTVEVSNVNENFTLNAPFAFINHPFNVSNNKSTSVVIDFHLNQDLNLNAKVFTPDVGYTQQ